MGWLGEGRGGRREEKGREKGRRAKALRVWRKGGSQADMPGARGEGIIIIMYGRFGYSRSMFR